MAVDSERHVVAPEVEAQARKAFENLGSVLDAAGESLESVGKVTTYVVDLEHHVDGYRPVWTDVFDEPYPCQTAIGVDQLSPFADGTLLIEVTLEDSGVRPPLEGAHPKARPRRAASLPRRSARSSGRCPRGRSPAGACP
jgi:hypothetical protein